MSSVFDLVLDLMEAKSQPDSPNVPEAFDKTPQSKSEWRQESEFWAEYQDGKLTVMQTYPPDGVGVRPVEPKKLKPARIVIWHLHEARSFCWCGAVG